MCGGAVRTFIHAACTFRLTPISENPRMIPIHPFQAYSTRIDLPEFNDGLKPNLRSQRIPTSRLHKLPANHVQHQHLLHPNPWELSRSDELRRLLRAPSNQPSESKFAVSRVEVRAVETKTDNGAQLYARCSHKKPCVVLRNSPASSKSWD